MRGRGGGEGGSGGDGDRVRGLAARGIAGR